MRDSLRPRSARVPRTSSLRKLTRSRAISTASRSLDAPSDALASLRRRGSSQNALRTFPIRVARAPDVLVRGRDERRPVFETRRLDVVGTGPHFSYAREQDTVRTEITELVPVRQVVDSLVAAGIPVEPRKPEGSGRPGFGGRERFLGDSGQCERAKQWGCYPAVTPALELVRFEFRDRRTGSVRRRRW
jgi:hypothetical protein